MGFIRIVVLGLVAFTMGLDPVYGQCAGGRCFASESSAGRPAFSWRMREADGRYIGLYFGAEQVASLDRDSGDVHRIDRDTGEFVDLRASVVGQSAPETVAAPGPQGLDRRGILKSGERWTINGEPASGVQAKRVLTGAANVPDDSAAPSLTLIGSSEACGAALASIGADAELSGLAGRYLVQSFRPDNPLVAGAGFVLDGAPSIYGQLADGRVLFRADGLDSVGQLAGALARGLEVAEGKRAPDPSYSPSADAGLTVKPQVDVNVPAPAWFLALTHLGALMLGGLGALGGRWALVSMLLAPAMQAMEERIASKMAPPPPKA